MRNVETAGRWHDAIFRTVPTPAGPVEVRRSPADAHDALTTVAGAAADRELLALRARAAEEKLDPAAAEADWTRLRERLDRRRRGTARARRLLSSSSAAAEGRGRAGRCGPRGGSAGRSSAAVRPSGDRGESSNGSFALVDAQQLPDAFAEAQCRAWIARYPQESGSPTTVCFASSSIATARPMPKRCWPAISGRFPSDDAWVLKGRADLATRRGATSDALAVYDQAFRPLWDAGNVQGYFELLERTHSLRAFLDRARADIAARPADLTPVARVFYYYQRAGNVGAAEQALADFEARRDSATRTADELFTLARLYEKTRNHNEALRYHASIYSLPGASPADVEQALASIIDTLFTAPEQPLRFGSGDLSFYRDIATIDRYPGFLNGILSLLFNSASPSGQYAQAAGVGRVVLPSWPRGRPGGAVRDPVPEFTAARRPERHARRHVCRVWRIGRGDRSRTAVPRRVPRRARADRRRAGDGRRVRQEGAGGGGIRRVRPAAPGAGGPGRSGAAWRRHDAGGGRATRRGRPAPGRRNTGACSIAISRVWSRAEQLPDALAVYRREIDRNPDDPGLYAAAAQFLEQNSFTAEVEQVYRLAIQQFPDRSWHHRLARWYLRRAAVGRVRDADARRHADVRGDRSGALLPGGRRPRARPSTRRCSCSSICTRTSGSRII